MSKTDHERHGRPRKQQDKKARSARSLDEISKELHDLMLGHRSDAIPIKLARRALGPLLVQQVQPAALRRGLIGERTFGRPLIDAKDWSISKSLPNNQVHSLMEQLVQYGRAYREMPAYAMLLTRVLDGKPVVINEMALNSEAVIDAYFERYLKLIESIRRFGVLPHGAVGASSDDPLVRLPQAERSERDIKVAIGPNGEVLRLGTGRHRTAIAQALGVEHMPVEIRLIHAEWLFKLVERSGKSPLDALLDWLNAAKHEGLQSQASD